MSTAVEITGADLNHWISGTRFFATSDNLHFVVSADLDDYPTTGMVTFLRRPTHVFYCNEDGSVTDLVPDETYPPGTTAEQAIALMGYTLQN